MDLGKSGQSWDNENHIRLYDWHKTSSANVEPKLKNVYCSIQNSKTKQNTKMYSSAIHFSVGLKA